MAKGDSKLFRFFAWALGLGILAVVLAGVALRLFLPPEKIQKLVVEKASEALRREVRLRGVSVSVLKGLALDGLEVSESPSFAAGTFLAVNEFQLKVELMPLLHKKVVVDKITVVGPLISVIKDKKGRFNFDDLAAPPPQEKKAAAKPRKTNAAPTAIAFELKVKRAAMTGGRVEYTDRGTGMSMNLTGIEAAASQLEFDAASGGLSVTLDKLAASLAGLEVSVGGKVRLDPKKLEVPDMRGRLGDGELKLAMTARDYLKAPEVSLDVSLSSLDLDRLMAVKQATLGSSAPASAAAGPAASAAPASQSATTPPLKTKGQAVVGQMTYSGAKLNETKVSWELSGITPDLRGVGGWAKLHVAGGTFTGEKKEGGRKGLMKALMIPVTVLQTVGGLLSPLKIVPDFNHILFTEVVGDYVFSRGVMTIRDFHMDSAAAGVRTSGSVDLGAQRLSLLAAIQPVNVAPIEIDVTGSFDKPSVKPRLTKLLANPVKNITNQLLKSLFKK